MGIISNKNYVFLTDDVEYYINVNGYTEWKANTLKKDTEFCVIRVDASALKKRHAIYSIDREHEFVTKKAEPEFLLFD